MPSPNQGPYRFAAARGGPIPCAIATQTPPIPAPRVKPPPLRPLFQTASARAAGPAADVAQAMIVTAWNIAIFGGAVTGGVILETAGAGGLSGAGIALLVGAAGSALCIGRRRGWPKPAMPGNGSG